MEAIQHHYQQAEGKPIMHHTPLLYSYLAMALPHYLQLQKRSLHQNRFPKDALLLQGTVDTQASHQKSCGYQQIN